MRRSARPVQPAAPPVPERHPATPVSVTSRPGLLAITWRRRMPGEEHLSRRPLAALRERTSELEAEP